ncbi:hypothetical protein D3C84_661080 [compost metagenome]
MCCRNILERRFFRYDGVDRIAFAVNRRNDLVSFTFEGSRDWDNFLRSRINHNGGQRFNGYIRSIQYDNVANVTVRIRNIG